MLVWGTSGWAHSREETKSQGRCGDVLWEAKRHRSQGTDCPTDSPAESRYRGWLYQKPIPLATTIDTKQSFQSWKTEL